jgi:carbonic anhydrase
VEYKLKEFHFHHPTEHKLATDLYQMECHLVHEPVEPVEPCAPVQYAVIAVFLSPGRILNKALSPVWRKIKPNTEGGVTANPVDLRHLVPNKERRTPVYRYMGSLTTGDEVAKEGIMWTIFEKPVEAFQLQIDQFTRNYPVNARKTRPLYRRFLLAKTR